MDEAAESAGLPGVIAHGMLTAAVMGSLLSPWLEVGYVQSLYVRFSGMVFVADELRVGGNVAGVEEKDGGRVFAFEVYVKRGAEDVVASGEAEFMVSGEPPPAP